MQQYTPLSEHHNYTVTSVCVHVHGPRKRYAALNGRVPRQLCVTSSSTALSKSISTQECECTGLRLVLAKNCSTACQGAPSSNPAVFETAAKLHVKNGACHLAGQATPSECHYTTPMHNPQYGHNFLLFGADYYIILLHYSACRSVHLSSISWFRTSSSCLENQDAVSIGKIEARASTERTACTNSACEHCPEQLS